MDNKKCDGWSNYETWKVKLELIEEIELIEDYEIDVNQPVEELAIKLQALVESIIEDKTNSSFVYDCVMQTLAQVNWLEIAAAVIDENDI